MDNTTILTPEMIAAIPPVGAVIAATVQGLKMYFTRIPSFVILLVCSFIGTIGVLFELQSLSFISGSALFASLIVVPVGGYNTIKSGKKLVTKSVENNITPQ